MLNDSTGLQVQYATFEPMKPQVFSSRQRQTTPLAGLTEHVGPVMTLRRCVLQMWATVHLLQLHHSDGERVGILRCAFSSRSRSRTRLSGGKPRVLTDSLSGSLLGEYSELLGCNDPRYLRDQQGSLQSWGTWFPLTWMRAGGRWLQVRHSVIYQHTSHYLKTSPLS